MNYTFDALSPADFEDLVRDLLQLEFSITLEAFKDGRDQGIDLRYSRDSNSQLVVQCKHYARTGFAGLRAQLERDELRKIEKLKPQRYVLATSVPLSPGNKTTLVELLAPHVIAPQDIYGADDINSLLARHSGIERRHFKLWLASVQALERFFERATHVRTEALISRVKERLRLYAHNESFERALAILSEHRTCIIAGVPGIGKTTLADVLMVHHMDQQYEIVEISNDIEEGERLLTIGTNQFFYYDDFLGTAFDERLTKNEDARILGFMQRVASSPNKRFVLTTREYILRGAVARYERFATSRKFEQKCVVSMADYTAPVRAKILYNHIHFSELGASARKALVAGKGYRNVIAHKNFSPRLVEQAIRFAIDERIEGKSFPKFLSDTLDNPVRVWDHAFQHQMPRAAQCVLLVLLALPHGVHHTDLFVAAHALARVRLGDELSEPQFREHLRWLESTFVDLSETDDGTGLRRVTFHTPAVPDYLLSYLNQETSEVEHLFRAAVFFEQPVALCRAGLTREQAPRSATEVVLRYPGLKRALLQRARAVAEAFERTMAVQTCTPTVFPQLLGSYVAQPSEDARLAALVDLAARLEMDALSSLTDKLLVDAHARWREHRGERVAVAQIVDTRGVPEQIRSELHSWALRKLDTATEFDLATSIAERGDDPEFREQVENEFYAFVDAQEDYILKEATDAAEAQNMLDEVRSLGVRLDLDAHWNESAVKARIAELEEPEPDTFDSERARDAHSEIADGRGEEEAIDALFDSLLEGDLGDGQ